MPIHKKTQSEEEMNEELSANIERYISKTDQRSTRPPLPREKIIEDQAFFPGSMKEDFEEDVEVKEELKKPEKKPAAPIYRSNPSFDPNASYTSQKFFKDRKSGNSNNPLMKYFREPGIQTKLPSNGHFSELDSINFSVNGEIPIYPLTAKDELWLKNPDALLNGSALENILRSCCPDISNIRDLPINDINVLLLAVRYASYGKKLELKAKCPKCKSEHVYFADIEELLTSLSFLDPEYSLTLENGITVYLRPYSYDSVVKATIVAFEENRIIEAYSNEEFTEKEREQAIVKSLENIHNLNLYLLTRSVVKIVTPDGDEIEKFEFIEEWLADIDSKTYKALNKKIEELNNIGVPKDYMTECSNEECKHHFPVEVIFDPARFFE